MKLSRATIALYVGLVFLSGGVLGFFANRLYTASTVNANAKIVNVKAPSPAEVEFRKRFVGIYQTRLHLSDDQMQKLNLILDESQAQVNAVHSRMDPELDAVRQNQITRMNLMLTPEQQTEYEKMRQERIQRQKEQQEKMRNGRGGGNGPGF